MTADLAPFAHLRGPALLAEWRKKTGKTQREVAHMLDIDASRYCAIENARNRPGLDHAVVIERLTRGAVKPADWALDRRGEALAEEIVTQRGKRA